MIDNEYEYLEGYRIRQTNWLPCIPDHIIIIYKLPHVTNRNITLWITYALN